MERQRPCKVDFEVLSTDHSFDSSSEVDGSVSGWRRPFFIHFHPCFIIFSSIFDVFSSIFKHFQAFSSIFIRFHTLLVLAHVASSQLEPAAGSERQSKTPAAFKRPFGDAFDRQVRSGALLGGPAAVSRGSEGLWRCGRGIGEGT